MRSTRPSTLTLYQVCDDPPNEAPYKPVSVTQHVSKHDALADLQECRQDHAPNSYLAQITYTRLPETQKGR